MDGFEKVIRGCVDNSSAGIKGTHIGPQDVTRKENMDKQAVLLLTCILYLPPLRSELIRGSHDPGKAKAARGLAAINTFGQLQSLVIATEARCIRELTEIIAANGHPPHCP